MSSLETSRQNNFDLLRLAAALQVAFLHCVEHLKIPLSDLGFALASLFPGVPIFFVISGFLISASFERTRSTRRYFINRILRIYPALWVCLAVSIASFLAFGHVRFRYRDFLLWLVAQISFFQFYNPDFLRNYGIGVLNGSLWTIPVELQFYALLPLLYRVWRRLHWSNTVALSIIAALIATNQIFVAIRAGGGGRGSGVETHRSYRISLSVHVPLRRRSAAEFRQTWPPASR